MINRNTKKYTNKLIKCFLTNSFTVFLTILKVNSNSGNILMNLES